MYQSQSIHLGEGDVTAAEMFTAKGAAVREVNWLTLNLGGAITYIHGTPDQLLAICAQMEQAARAWQMERDGVGEEDRATVLAATR